MKIITGMHRSGTSMVSNLVMEIGGRAGSPADFVEADRWNENGYFENKEFVILNNSILVGEFSPSSIFLRYPPEKRNSLIRAAMSLSNFNYVRLMLSPGLIHRRAAPRRREMEFLARRFDDHIIKDPRFSLLIGDWQQAGRVEKTLFCFRHPYEAAHSLRRRNRVPLAFGLRLWLFHNEIFLKHAQGLPVTYVHYERFFSPQAQLEELKRLYWFVDREFDEREALGHTHWIVNSSLRHHAAADAPLPARIAAAYERLLQLHAHTRPD
jgi:hypothetical protein